MRLRVTIEFSGGAETLFNGQKRFDITLPEQVDAWTIKQLLVWIKDNLLAGNVDLFLRNDTVRPGIIVAVNDTDWELLDTINYQIKPNDNILFISSLHGVGRAIIELYDNIVPRTCENFRALCTGEKGQSPNGVKLHYKNTYVHSVREQFSVQAGDIVNLNGSGGESIYGQYFNDENFTIKHGTEGVVSMANAGQPHTNSSQFVITTVPCPHLDGTNVAFGKVIKGFGVIREISQIPSNDNDVPLVACKISDCGQVCGHDDASVDDCDETPDKLPPWPEDLSSNHAISSNNILETIKDSGLYFFKSGNFVESDRKYRKLWRYIEWVRCDSNTTYSDEYLQRLKLITMLNLATVKYKRGYFKDALSYCNEVIKKDGTNCKAYYRRAQIHNAMNEHKLALADLNIASKLKPGDHVIGKQISTVKDTLRFHLANEKKVIKRMFKSQTF